MSLPKPYYQDDACTIYHGDTLDVLSGLESSVNAHAVVMDPPYASGTRSEANRTSSGAMLRGVRWAQKPIENDQMTTPGFVWLMRETCYALKPILEGGASVFSFIDWRQWPTLLGAVESTNLRVNQMLVWDKMSYGLGNGFRASHELILHASKGVPHIATRATGNILRHKRETNSNHPSPKPPGLIEDLLKVTTVPGDLVLDPFMGCGPTLEAAKHLGRKAIGIEIDERYCEIAARRLTQEVLPLGI